MVESQTKKMENEINKMRIKEEMINLGLDDFAKFSLDKYIKVKILDKTFNYDLITRGTVIPNDFLIIPIRVLIQELNKFGTSINFKTVETATHKIEVLGWL